MYCIEYEDIYGSHIIGFSPKNSYCDFDGYSKRKGYSKNEDKYEELPININTYPTIEMAMSQIEHLKSSKRWFKVNLPHRDVVSYLNRDTKFNVIEIREIIEPVVVRYKVVENENKIEDK
jgi:hypothetical protein